MHFYHKNGDFYTVECNIDNIITEKCIYCSLRTDWIVTNDLIHVPKIPPESIKIIKRDDRRYIEICLLELERLIFNKL